jgi:hypothetical protein
VPFADLDELLIVSFPEETLYEGVLGSNCFRVFRGLGGGYVQRKNGTTTKVSKYTKVFDGCKMQ